MKRTVLTVALAAVAVAGLLVAPAAEAQFRGPTTPPGGENQKASVSQWIGRLVEVNITYNSPDVTSPTGEDRTGKIWGQLVPYGMANLNFGSCGENCPWRAGANENTVFTVSRDVLIEGKPLPAGSYGLHMIPGEEEWTIIFSKNYTSWGSFTYDESEDALRVTVKPKENQYTHWLTYAFTDRQPEQATVALQWENLQVPWTISVDNMTEMYVEAIRNDLRTTTGFNWIGYNGAAQYLIGQEVHPEEALQWAEAAVSLPFIGQENFTTLSTLAQAQGINNMSAESEATLQQALRHPTATPGQIHQAGRQLIARGEKEKALEVFELNAELNPNIWPVNVGMARGLSAVGRYDDAIPYVVAALANAPDKLNQDNLERLKGLLEEGKDIN